MGRCLWLIEQIGQMQEAIAKAKIESHSVADEEDEQNQVLQVVQTEPPDHEG
jgi:predicted RNA-binding protein YlxR (DUF448 family)